MEQIFARSIINMKRENLVEYVTSLHFLPVIVTASLAPVFWLTGYGNLGLITLYGGLATLALTTWLSPILALTPLCGPYRASLKELPATKGSEERGYPPLTLFYPTTEPLKAVNRWLPFMDQRYLQGMASYVRMPYFLIRDMQLTQVEAHFDAQPHPLFRKDGSQRPIFIHSHGLAGFARLYSTFLMTVAAQGAFVVAINHTDRSAAFCRDATGDFGLPLRTDIGWNYRDREPQLRTRIDEVQSTITHLLNGNILRRLGLAEADIQRYVENKPQVVLVGHSFGGATMLATAHEEEKKMRQGKSSFYEAIAGVVAHDPWAVPLRGRFLPVTEADNAEAAEEARTRPPFDAGEATYSVPTLLHHSQAWKMDEAVWGFFSSFDAAVHAQLADPHLLKPFQRKRIEEATTRMAQASQAPQVDQESDAVNGGEAPKAVDSAALANGHAASERAEDWFITHTAMETGHLSVTDLSFLSPVVFKKSYQTNRPEAPIHQWANELVRFAEVHVEKNMNL